MNCLNNTAVIGCFNDGTNPPKSVIIHTVYDNEGPPAVRITDASGAIVSGANATNTTPGACQVCTELTNRGLQSAW